MRVKNHIGVVLLLAPFVFSYSFGLDIYIPVIPEMRWVFHTTPFLIQMTLSLFLLGIGLGDIVIGPISDHVGRVKVIYASLILFILGALGCVYAHTINELLIARVICAIGSCGLLVVAFAIVRDVIDAKHCGKMYSWLNAAIGISPTFAPFIGGLLSAHYGWQSVFWFLVGMGVFVFLLSLIFMRETLPKPRRKKMGIFFLKRYQVVFQNKTFVRYMCLAGLGVGICFSFFSVSPFIIIRLLHVPPTDFGLCFAIFGLVLLFGGMLSGQLCTHLGIDKTINIGIILIFIGGVAMLLINLLWKLNLYTFLGSMVFACSGAVFCTGAGAAGAMMPFDESAGSAAAALQAGQFSISAVIGSILMHFPVHSSISYAICILCVGVLACGIILYTPNSHCR